MSDESGFYIESADFEKNFEAFVRAAGQEAAARGLFTAAQAVLTAADDEIPQTPYLHGDLRASRQVLQPEITAEKIAVTFGYNSEYAAYQHEGQRKDGSHVVKEYTTTRVPSPGAKFLQKKMAGNTRRFMAIVVDHIRRSTGGSPK